LLDKRVAFSGALPGGHEVLVHELGKLGCVFNPSESFGVSDELADGVGHLAIALLGVVRGLQYGLLYVALLAKPPGGVLYLAVDVVELFLDLLNLDERKSDANSTEELSRGGL